MRVNVSVRVKFDHIVFYNISILTKVLKILEILLHLRIKEQEITKCIHYCHTVTSKEHI